MVNAILTPSSSNSTRPNKTKTSPDRQQIQKRMTCTKSDFASMETRKLAGKLRTNIGGFDSDAFLSVRSFGGIANLVRQNLRLAKGIHKGGSTSSRGTYTPPPRPKTSARCHVSDKSPLTNHHHGELHTLLDFISSTSTSERHGSFGVLREKEKVG